MNSRLSSLKSALISLADACIPVKRKWRVKYFKRVPTGQMYQGKPTFTTEWVTEVVWAYNREGAAQVVNAKLRPGYNCLVTKIMPGEEGYEEPEGV